MIATTLRDWDRDRDLVALGAGFAVIAGGLSVVIPFLAGLVLALSFIVFATWLIESFSRSRESSPAYRLPRAWSWTSVALFAATLLLYFDGPPTLAPFHGLALAVSPVACWWLSRRRVERSRRA
jgi:hypothetical protein